MAFGLTVLLKQRERNIYIEKKIQHLILLKGKYFETLFTTLICNILSSLVKYFTPFFEIRLYLETCSEKH